MEVNQMDPVKIKLAGLWAATMFSYQKADILRIYSADYAPGGDVFGSPPTQTLWFVSAVFMTFPFLMILLSLFLAQKANRWANMVMAFIFFGVNLYATLGYESAYDTYLGVVGLVFNVIVFWLALKCKPSAA